MEADQGRLALVKSQSRRKGVKVMEGTFTFKTEGENKLIISDSQASPVKNQLKIKVIYDLDEEPEISRIKFSFPAGKKRTDFAEYGNLKQIEFKVDGWSVKELSKEEFRNLRYQKKENPNIGWYVCRYKEGEALVYALAPGVAWKMKDHLIMNLSMENVVTTAAEGTCTISCSVEDIEEESQEYGLEIIKEQSHSVRILDFYPESGSAWEGEEVSLKWRAENAEKILLCYEGQEQELEPSRSDIEVTVSRSTEYILKAINGDKEDSRETMIQVVPLFLKQFTVDYKEEKLIWDVCCGKNIKINGVLTQFSSGEKDLFEYSKGEPIVLNAEGKNTSVESYVYYGTEEECTDVVHFQKTITFYKGFQLLDVSWQLFELEREDVAKSIRIVYQDRERNELYDIKGGESLGTKGCWQQILTGTEPSGAGENILMTMYVELFGDGASQDYEITI